jgi:NAD(P)-dependent dehydrogenase (short-subunit alcohol dehydrogenase family)
VAYCATKGGLTQMTRALARDHAADGIRVNVLSPGGGADRTAGGFVWIPGRRRRRAGPGAPGGTYRGPE